MVAFGVIYWLRSVMREITYNAGLGRPIHLHVPEGNLLNPDATAAVGVRSVTMLRAVDAFCGALAQALPDAIPAAGGGQSSILLISVPNPDTGKMKVSVVQPLCGGSGARPQADGIDGVDLLMGYLRNIPTEVIEAEMPGVLLHRYAFARAAAGPAGGAAVSGWCSSSRSFSPTPRLRRGEWIDTCSGRGAGSEATRVRPAARSSIPTGPSSATSARSTSCISSPATFCGY